jgi:hypothetical protein
VRPAERLDGDSGRRRSLLIEQLAKAWRVRAAGVLKDGDAPFPDCRYHVTWIAYLSCR